MPDDDRKEEPNGAVFKPDHAGIARIERELKKKFDRLQARVAREHASEPLKAQAKALVEAGRREGFELNEAVVLRLMQQRAETLGA